MSLPGTHDKKTTTRHIFPNCAIDIIHADKSDDGYIEEFGNNAHHVIGAKIASNGTYRSTWRFMGPISPVLKPCDILSYIPPEVPWGTVVEGRGKAAGISCHFSRDYFRKIAGIDDDRSISHLEACRDIHGVTIKQGLRRIYGEIIRPDFSSDALVESFAGIIAIEMARYFKRAAIKRRGSPNSTMDRHELLRIRDYIYECSEERLLISDIAAYLGYSERHIHQTFRASFGITPHDFIKAVKIRKSVDLLNEGVLSIKQIAHNVGFSRQSSFSAAFRSTTGATPAETRRLGRTDFACLHIGNDIVRAAVAGQR